MVRLLLVDDHAPFRAVARQMLEQAGFTVVGEAADGAEALRAAGALVPDVALLDVGLPDVDGFDVGEVLARAGVVVVMMSSRDAADYADSLATSSARGFIPKSRLSAATLTEVLA